MAFEKAYQNLNQGEQERNPVRQLIMALIDIEIFYNTKGMKK